MDVQLGCMPRPWNKFSHDDALAGIAAAGFKNYAFLGHKEATVSSETSPEDAQQLAARVRAAGLEPRMIYSATRLDAPEDDVLARVKRLIDNAQRTGATVLIEGGTGKPENFDTYFSIMRRAAPYAHECGVTIALKPHGGLSTTGDDTLKAIQAVNHPAYRLCFDPGNLLYYAGLRPEVELRKLAPYVVAMCVKDETGGNGPDRTVNVTPGDGDVDFPAVFKILNDHDFAAKPAIVETLGGQTLEEVNQEAKRAYEYLTGVLANV
jgi:sugar phosphate isomerase/epimerase